MNYKYKTIILFLSVFFIFQLKAQTIMFDIIKWDSSEKKIDLSTLNKITFTSSDLILNYQAGTAENVAKSDIRKLVFSSTTGVNQINAVKTLQVYPNPAYEFIQVKNIPDASYIATIYSITGSQVLSIRIYTISQQIDISSLSKGLYFLKINNQITKFTKL